MTGKKKGSKQEEKRTCTYQMHDGKSCGRVLYDGEYCIFHSKDIERKKDKFNDDFKKEFKSQKEREGPFDFSGFVFPVNYFFKEVVFDKDVHFSEAKFHGTAIFLDARFSKEVYFSKVEFLGNHVDFTRAVFSGFADFSGVQFPKYTDSPEAIKEIEKYVRLPSKPIENYNQIFDFSAAKFHGSAEFGHAKFFGSVNFFGVKFFKVAYFGYSEFTNATTNFYVVEFHDIASFTGVIFDKVNFDGAKFYKAAGFVDVNFNECSMKYTFFYKVSGLFEFIEVDMKRKKKDRKFKYTQRTEFLPDNFQLILGEEATARYPVISRQIRDDMYLLDKNERNSNTKGIKGWWYRTLYFLWWLFADYGRSFGRWALWSLIFAEIFAIVFGLFYYCNPASIKSEVISFSWPGISLLYYSVVTFTTLGFGDIVPKIPELQIIIMLEVILGYIMLGGLISILANKLARRS